MADNAAAERIDEHLAGIDAAELWGPTRHSYFYRAALGDYERMAVAYARGLCTDAELSRWLRGYEFAAGQPGGWKWWLRGTLPRSA